MKNKAILIVDDERNIRLTIKRAIEPLEIASDEAANGEDALDKLEKKSYELILLDLKMPGMSGMDLLQEIRRKGSQIKALIITAHGTIDNAVEAMKLGAVDFIQKPFSPQQIRGIISDAIRRGTGFLHKLIPVAGEDRERFREVISDEEVHRLKSEVGTREEEDYEFCIEQSKAAGEATDFESAEAWAQKAIAFAPGRPEGFNLLGVFCELRRDRLQAQKYYRAALALDPTYKPAWNNLDRSTEMDDKGKLDLGGKEKKPEHAKGFLAFLGKRKVPGKEER